MELLGEEAAVVSIGQSSAKMIDTKARMWCCVEGVTEGLEERVAVVAGRKDLVVDLRSFGVDQVKAGFALGPAAVVAAAAVAAGLAAGLAAAAAAAAAIEPAVGG